MSDELHDQIKQRKAKLDAWRKDTQAYPNALKPDHNAASVHAQFGEVDRETLAAKAPQMRLAGRIMMRRQMGKASFITVQDGTGVVQWYVKQNDLTEDSTDYEAFKGWDLGDIVWGEGTLFRTKTGELSLACSQVHLLSKALRPLPDKYHGLQDHEMRHRKRYLDILTNRDSKAVFETRARTVHMMRSFFVEHGFMEVETPMMHPIPGGATAKPFVTHLNAMDMPLYLRIAPELYLKRLIVGGMDRVFELNRNFRNEGISTRHNPEFTMVEFYQAYADYEDMMRLSEDLLHRLVTTLFGEETLTYQGQIISFKKPFARLSMQDAIVQYCPEVDPVSAGDLEKLRALSAPLKLEGLEQLSLGQLQLAWFEERVEKQLIQPTFITEYPTAVSPLARRNNDNPEITDRFELFIAGQEVANGFSELNDPEDQASRFQDQVMQRDAGDQEAMYFDADYIEALEYGMPPTAGQGIGIDRLVMLLTDSASIRDVLMFPLLRPKGLAATE